MSQIGQYLTSSTSIDGIKKINTVPPTALGVLSLVAGAGITITNNPATNEVTITGSLPGSFYWNVVTNDTTLSNNNGYIPNWAGELVFMLPATSEVGDNIKITGNFKGNDSGNIWVLKQHAGQMIRLEGEDGLVGVDHGIKQDISSYLVTKHPTQSVELICVVGGASSQWIVLCQCYGEIVTF